MRILFIAPWVPSHVRPRSLGLLRILAERHDVWVVAADTGHEHAAALRELPLAGVEIVPVRRLPALARVLAAPLRGRSVEVSYLEDRALRRRIEHRAGTWRPDVVHLNVARSGSWSDVAPGVPVVFDLDDIRSGYYAQLQNGGHGLVNRLLGRYERRHMAAIEQQAVETAQSVLVSSPVDVDGGAPNVHLVRSPYRAAPVVRRPDGVSVLFVGRMSFLANRTAIDWFVDQVLPLLLARHPDVQLRIVGERPSKALLARASDGVRVVGPVPDLAEEYATATVAVVPVATGTGVQMKLIQALAHGVPCVAAPEAARRAGLTPGMDVLTARDAQEWAATIGRVLDSPEEADPVVAQGHAWVAANHSEQAVQEALDRAYRHLG